SHLERAMNQAGKEHYHDTIGVFAPDSKTPKGTQTCPAAHSKVLLQWQTSNHRTLCHAVRFNERKLANPITTSPSLMNQSEKNSRSEEKTPIKKPLMKTNIPQLSFVALLGAALTLTQHAGAQTTTWTGAVGDQNWSTAGNWSTSGGSTPPGTTDAVVFGTGAF